MEIALFDMKQSPAIRKGSFLCVRLQHDSAVTRLKDGKLIVNDSNMA
jgi:hypothetical protein